jgi:hypothetical protein
MPLILFALGSALRLLVGLGLHLRFEDSLITLRVAANLAHGLGPVYNPGVAVQSATSPLHMGLLAGLIRLLGEEAAAQADQVLGALAGSAAAVLAGHAVRPAGAGCALAVTLLLLAYPPLVIWSVSGMETPLLLLAMAAAVVLALRGRLFACGLALGAAALCRPDALLFCGLVLAALAWHRRAQALPPALVLALVLAPWLLYAAHAYGTVVPQTVVAKAQLYRSGVLFSGYRLHRIFGPLFRLRPELGPRLLVVPALLGLIAHGARRSAAVRWVGLFLCAHMGLYFLSGTIAMVPWYYVPAHAALLVAAVLSAAPLVARPVLVSLPLLGLLAVCWRTDLAQARSEQRYEDQVRRPLGEWLRVRGAPHDVAVLEAAGYLGYHSRLVIVDSVGLCAPDALRARRQVRGDAWWVALVRAVAPRYLVLREREVAENWNFVGGGRLLPEAEDAAWFRRHYRLRARFGAHGYAPLEVYERDL